MLSVVEKKTLGQLQFWSRFFFLFLLDDFQIFVYNPLIWHGFYYDEIDLVLHMHDSHSTYLDQFL